jgi:hypothetical protein
METGTSDAQLKRIRIERPMILKERRYDPPLLDPRDPDILRAKQLMDVHRSQEGCR